VELNGILVMFLAIYFRGKKGRCKTPSVKIDVRNQVELNGILVMVLAIYFRGRIGVLYDTFGKN
jgi:hypothetical protein